MITLKTTLRRPVALFTENKKQSLQTDVRISGVSTNYSFWRSSGKNTEKKKYQIDLVIDRNDRVINLC